MWFVVTLVAATSLPATALAGALEGRLTDSMTGTPIPEATVHVLGTDRTATTDSIGRWSFELPDGEYTLEIEARLGDETETFRVVDQHVPQYKSADTHLPTDHFLERGVPRLSRPIGAPVPRIDDPSTRGGSYDLDNLPDAGPEAAPDRYTLPESPPVTIRVARRENEETCSSRIVAIEEVPLESYAKGVLAPEIGVFRNQQGASEVFEAFAPAAKSYALWFVLRHRAGNRRTVDEPKPPHGHEWFHLDDTPCNQRYSDMRFDRTDRAAEARSGQILVKQGAPDTIDKFEYAASCGGHGTRPEYQNAIVPDDSPARACVGDWCGHDNCAGHADHPDVSGTDSCLVRGICQWGALEWADAGRDADWLLDHYQPNLTLRDIGDERPETVTLTGFVHTDPDNVADSGVPGATVRLADGRETTTDETGRYTLREVPLSRGTVTATASKAGYTANTRSRTLEGGQTNLLSIPIDKSDDSPDNADTGPDDGPSGDTGVADGGDTLPSPDAGPPPTTGRYGGLGPMIAPSSGTHSGCTAAPPTDEKPSRRPPIWPGVVALGSVLARIRR
jgi:hypothetical protein